MVKYHRDFLGSLMCLSIFIVAQYLTKIGKFLIILEAQFIFIRKSIEFCIVPYTDYYFFTNYRGHQKHHSSIQYSVEHDFIACYLA
jgi:hypothetical protein